MIERKKFKKVLDTTTQNDSAKKIKIILAINQETPLLVNMNHKSPMDRFIKNNEISEERVKEFFRFKRHLEHWQLILKENVFNSLKCWVDKKNGELQSLMLGGGFGLLIK